MQPRGLQLIRIRPSNEIKQIASDAPPYFLTTFLLFSMTMPLVPLVADAKGWGQIVTPLLQMPQGRGSWHDMAHSSRVGFFLLDFWR